MSIPEFGQLIFYLLTQSSMSPSAHEEVLSLPQKRSRSMSLIRKHITSFEVFDKTKINKIRLHIIEIWLCAKLRRSWGKSKSFDLRTQTRSGLIIWMTVLSNTFTLLYSLLEDTNDILWRAGNDVSLYICSPGQSYITRLRAEPLEICIYAYVGFYPFWSQCSVLRYLYITTATIDFFRPFFMYLLYKTKVCWNLPVAVFAFDLCEQTHSVSWSKDAYQTSL